MRNVSFEADLLVCPILDAENKVFSCQDCLVACNKGLLIMAGKALHCAEMMGWLLANKVQVTQMLTLLLVQ